MMLAPAKRNPRVADSQRHGRATAPPSTPVHTQTPVQTKRDHKSTGSNRTVPRTERRSIKPLVTEEEVNDDGYDDDDDVDDGQQNSAPLAPPADLYSPSTIKDWASFLNYHCKWLMRVNAPPTTSRVPDTSAPALYGGIDPSILANEHGEIRWDEKMAHDSDLPSSPDAEPTPLPPVFWTELNEPLAEWKHVSPWWATLFKHELCLLDLSLASSDAKKEGAFEDGFSRTSFVLLGQSASIKWMRCALDRTGDVLTHVTRYAEAESAALAFHPMIQNGFGSGRRRYTPFPNYDLWRRMTDRLIHAGNHDLAEQIQEHTSMLHVLDSKSGRRAHVFRLLSEILSDYDQFKTAANSKPRDPAKLGWMDRLKSGPISKHYLPALATLVKEKRYELRQAAAASTAAIVTTNGVDTVKPTTANDRTIIHEPPASTTVATTAVAATATITTNGIRANGASTAATPVREPDGRRKPRQRPTETLDAERERELEIFAEAAWNAHHGDVAGENDEETTADNAATAAAAATSASTAADTETAGASAEARTVLASIREELGELPVATNSRAAPLTVRSYALAGPTSYAPAIPTGGGMGTGPVGAPIAPIAQTVPIAPPITPITPPIAPVALPIAPIAPASLVVATAAPVPSTSHEAAGNANPTANESSRPTPPAPKIANTGQIARRSVGALNGPSRVPAAPLLPALVPLNMEIRERES